MPIVIFSSVGADSVFPSALKTLEKKCPNTVDRFMNTQEIKSQVAILHVMNSR